ncbi:UDP-N-acetylglucosamine 2-epimerase [Flavobacteriaceae bacterium]|nr:UDP-N-acetylglucosamine 2-epimerase [Flavobacteriaceae bacterium]
MRIGVLTSSRADYGIYLPLLQKIKIDSFFELEIIAFGTHLSKLHGYTLTDIEKDGYKTIHKISSLIDDDSEKDIVISYGNTVLEFADFWSVHKFDLVFCLGDRFEMSAAVQASIPFGVKLAHLHGGETTLGAIDNIYRHQISLASKYHFVSTNENMQKVKQLIGSSNLIYDVGSLSLSNIETFKPHDRSVFFKNYGIRDAPYILVTFHPETISVQNNLAFAKAMKDALTILCNKINVIITMPNADTLGSVYRKELNQLKVSNPEKVLLVENFGKVNYFNAMFYSTLLIGNTSSGIIEAASFNRYVINVGDRQKGRIHGANVFNVPFESSQISSAVSTVLNKGDYLGKNVYYKKESAEKIIKILKNFK